MVKQFFVSSTSADSQEIRYCPLKYYLTLRERERKRERVLSGKGNNAYPQFEGLALAFPEFT